MARKVLHFVTSAGNPFAAYEGSVQHKIALEKNWKEVGNTPASFSKKEEEKAIEIDVTIDEDLEEEDMAQELKNKSVAELKTICKELGIRGYSKKKESELIEMIVAAQL